MRSLALAAALLIGACHDGRREVTDIEAMHIARYHISRHYPFYRLEGLRPVPHDQGDTWLVTFEAPEGSVGGTPTVGVDKRTSRVVYFRGEQ